MPSRIFADSIQKVFVFLQRYGNTHLKTLPNDTKQLHNFIFDRHKSTKLSKIG